MRYAVLVTGPAGAGKSTLCNGLQQFMRAANLYFLVVVLMQAIPGLSPTPWQATALPLIFVLTVNAIKVHGSHGVRWLLSAVTHIHLSHAMGHAIKFIHNDHFIIILYYMLNITN